MRSLFRVVLNKLPRPLLIRLSYLIRPVLAFVLKGKRYTDPLDGRSFREFLPYGHVKVRPNVLSPSTLSLERHRLMWLYLQRETNFFKDHQKVLHFAPEQAFIKRFRKMRNLDYTTTDLNSPLADVKADICDLPFEDNSYDFIICNHVLEHIPDDRKAMSELYRILKPGGTGIFQIPQDLTRKETYEDFSITDPKDREKHFGQYDHVRIYGKDFFNRLQAVGFKVNAVDYTNELTEEEVDRFRLMPGEVIPVVSK